MLLLSFSLIFGAAATAIIMFFGAGIAPVVFSKLDETDAGRVVRAVFPRYYLILGGLSIASTLTAVAVPLAALLHGLCAIGYGYARQSLMPRINAHRDLMMAGDETAEPVFDRLHAWSVRINMAQLVATLAALGLTMRAITV